MAKPIVFISSTFYDLKHVRADLDLFLDQLGYEPIRNEEGDIPYGKDDSLEEYCYKEIKGVDILVSIIGGKFGSESKKYDSSISQAELRTAISENKQVYIFIERNVLLEYETYLLNKGANINYRYVDDKRIYAFIEEIKSLSSNNNVKEFDSVSDITNYLKEQFAGLFQRFLQEQSRVKEVNLIKGLEKTAQTLNKLINFLQDENKGQADEINKILFINHPLVERIKSLLQIKYNFYFETLDDVCELLSARGYKDISNQFEYYYAFSKDSNKKHFVLKIDETLFDGEKKLKFVKKSDWNEKWIDYEVTDEPDDDDLPF